MKLIKRLTSTCRYCRYYDLDHLTVASVEDIPTSAAQEVKNQSVLI